MSTPEAPDDLQFDRAERAEVGDSAPASVACSSCGAAIATEYFERSGRILCAACREKAIAERNRGTRLTRFARAALFGLGAAVAGALLWYGVAKLTGYEFSLIAIVIGFLVGGAVRLGSRRRGGWLYQGLAMFLTYASIVSTYIPAILEAMATVESPDGAGVVVTEETAAEAAAATESAPQAPQVAEAIPPAPASPSEPTVVLESAEAAAEAEAAATTATDGPVADLPGPLRFAIGLFAIFALAFAAPFLAGFENFLGLIILAIGLYEAWKLNRKETLLFEGPFRVGAPRQEAPLEPTPPPQPPPPPIQP